MTKHTENFYLSTRYVMAREYGISPNQLPFNGAWVVRERETGKLIDWSRYSNDLLGKYPEFEDQPEEPINMMTPGQYLTKETLEKLGEENYNKFRDHLRSFEDYRICPVYGEFDNRLLQFNEVVILYEDEQGCDLMWTVKTDRNLEEEFTYEQVMECIQ